MLNDVVVEVIGVMPEGFRMPTDFTQDATEPTQLWRPLRLGGCAERESVLCCGAGLITDIPFTSPRL